MAQVQEKQKMRDVMKDVQSGGDTRALAINRVGIQGLRLPMTFCEGAQAQPAIGDWAIGSGLPATVRGTHMSRLVRVLHDDLESFNFRVFCSIPEKLMDKLSAPSYYVRVAFTTFVMKAAPVSSERGYLDVEVRFFAHRKDGIDRCLMQVVTPVTSLCPCSKVISKYGAHNQRSNITLTIESAESGQVRDLVAVAESGASSELYSMLKRSDERHVTERAYDNPKFVEDIVRDLAVVMEREAGVRAFRVEAENFESIHNHSAYAMIESENFPTFMLI